MPEPGGLEILLAGLVGLVFGSFVTAASWRLPRRQPIALDRSRCPSCRQALAARDLVPVLSWVLSRGRCRRCGANVSARYPLIELATGALVAAIWGRFGGTPVPAALLALIGVGLMVVIVADLEAGIIPDKALMVLAPLGLAYRLAIDAPWPDTLAGAAAGFGLAMALRLGFKALRGFHGLGLGDVKFLAVAGLLLGAWGLVPFLVVAGVAGMVFGGLWRLAGGGAVFPFGPALAAGLLACLLYPEIGSLIVAMR